MNRPLSIPARGEGPACRAGAAAFAGASGRGAARFHHQPDAPGAGACNLPPGDGKYRA